MKRWTLRLVDAKSKLGAIVVAGAVTTHLFILGGSPLMAIVLLVVTGTVSWDDAHER
jgi:hypothetical protein